MSEESILSLGEKKILRSDFGPISFGLVLSGSVVPWSGTDSHDLLIGRCWEGIFVYPSKKLESNELNVEPIQVFSSTLGDIYALPVDWNKDGYDDILGSNRTGFLFYLRRKGEFPDISFELVEPLKDADSNLFFNIPYENPYHPVLNNLGGYFDTPFFNYLYPVVYPINDKQTINYIIGDWAGYLWWLPDLTDGKRQPVYRGVHYKKYETDIVTRFGKDLIQKYGYDYVKPTEKICDETGKPFLLGEGVDTGITYQGGNTRPAVYKNDITGAYDLLVLAGAMCHKLYYLQRINTGEHGKPIFKNLGEVKLDGMSLESSEAFSFEVFNFHSKVIVYNLDGWNDLMISAGCKIAVFKNKKLSTPVPEFQFSHWISGRDVITIGYNFTEVLRDRKTGKRYLLDNVNRWEFREVTVRDNEVRLSSNKIMLKDQHGVFSVEGETDPQLGKDWGFHRAAKWDFDKSGRQHLIVGTDKGLLYVLIEEKDLGTDGEFRFRSVGPLKDCNGGIIKVHNRARAVGIDLNGDGLEDLVLGGATYQLGTKTDPNPGGGIYYVINQGIDEHGVPLLSSIQTLKITGFEITLHINSHVHIQVLDLDNDGEKEVIIGTGEDRYKGRVFKVAKDAIELQYAGVYLEGFVIDRNLLDIDDDGHLEHVFGGGEQGVGFYRKIVGCP